MKYSFAKWIGVTALAGASLAYAPATEAGDLVGNRLDELVIGAPGEAPGGDPESGVAFLYEAPGNNPRSGAVFVYERAGDRLRGEQVLDQAGLGSNEAGDRFGATLASGDFDNDGFDDLVVAATGEAPGNDPRSGGVFVFRGAGGALRPHQFVDQAGLGVNESGDRFGASIADR